MVLHMDTLTLFGTAHSSHEQYCSLHIEQKESSQLIVFMFPMFRLLTGFEILIDDKEEKDKQVYKGEHNESAVHQQTYIVHTD
jgi:hypothetical protein